MLEGLTPPQQQRKCKVIVVADGLDVADKKIFLDAIGNDEIWSANGLSIELSKRGLSLAGDTIQKHRKGICQCSKT